MLYLTRLLIDLKACRQLQIRDVYSIHKLVYSCFPLSENRGNFLYADKGFSDGIRTVLILSEQTPQIPDSIRSATTELSKNFMRFNEFRFEVVLNPVKREKESGKRRAITGQLPLLKWFTIHAEKWGFAANENTLEVITLPMVKFKKGDADCLFHAVKFRGTLRVTDHSLFSETLKKGIGHGKAFGFGLLQLVPIKK